MQPRVILQYIDSTNRVADEFVENITYFSSLNTMGEMPHDFVNEIYKWALESVGVIALDKHFGNFYCLGVCRNFYFYLFIISRLLKIEFRC